MKKTNILQLIENIKSILDIQGAHVQGSDIDEEIVIEGFKFGYSIAVVIKNDKRTLVERVAIAQDLRSKGLKIREIAAILGISYATVYRYLHLNVSDLVSKKAQ